MLKRLCINQRKNNILFYIFRIPSNLSSDAVFMIQTILQLHFGNRPNIDQCYKIDFIHNYFIPDSLPNSCLRIQPTFENCIFLFF